VAVEERSSRSKHLLRSRSRRKRRLIKLYNTINHPRKSSNSISNKRLNLNGLKWKRKKKTKRMKLKIKMNKTKKKSKKILKKRSFKLISISKKVKHRTTSLATKVQMKKQVRKQSPQISKKVRSQRRSSKIEPLDSTEVSIDRRVTMAEAIPVEVVTMIRKAEEAISRREAVVTLPRVPTTKSRKESLSTMTDHTEEARVSTTISTKLAKREVAIEEVRRERKRNHRSRRWRMMDSSLFRADMRRTRNHCHSMSQRDPE
jgi:hypothetical protein